MPSSDRLLRRTLGLWGNARCGACDHLPGLCGDMALGGVAVLTTYVCWRSAIPCWRSAIHAASSFCNCSCVLMERFLGHCMVRAHLCERLYSTHVCSLSIHVVILVYTGIRIHAIGVCMQAGAGSFDYTVDWECIHNSSALPEGASRQRTSKHHPVLQTPSS